MRDMADMLRVYGPWGVTVALGFTVMVLWRYIVGMHAEQRGDIKEQTKVLVEVRDAMRAFHKTQDKLVDRLEA